MKIYITASIKAKVEHRNAYWPACPVASARLLSFHPIMSSVALFLFFLACLLVKFLGWTDKDRPMGLLQR